MVGDDDRLVLSPSDAEVAVALGRPEWPHDDALTFFAVTLQGPGLTATATVESLDGAEGMDPEPVPVGGEVATIPLLRLGAFLRGLGTAPTSWDGERAWRSFADELRVAVSCDRLGHATLVVTLRPTPWRSWSASASFVHPRGDLIGLGDAVEVWFRPPEA